MSIRLACIKVYFLMSFLLFFIGFYLLSKIFFYDYHHRALNCPISRQHGNTAYAAQYYEDYILSIVFANVTNGTYIDVGAYHPHIDSVTFYFYNQGWHGINIEPSYSEYQSFKKARPHDINLNVGAGNSNETVAFYKIAKTGLSTFDKQIAEKAKIEGFPYRIEYQRITTLNDILQRHISKINFIKIDVEGFEKSVLEGIDLKKYRPQVFVIEATEPRTRILSYLKWENILLDNHYQFAMFDGINRYYVGSEFSNLLKRFKLANRCYILEKNNGA